MSGKNTTKQMALETIVKSLSQLNQPGVHGASFGIYGNRFIDQERKDAIRTEIDYQILLLDKKLDRLNRGVHASQ